MTGTNAETNIRQAVPSDAARLAEIEIFNYRLNFYPIFQNDWFYFDELRVPKLIQEILADPERLHRTYVYDDGVVKGFIRLNGQQIEKLFVEPILQNQHIGAALLKYAVEQQNARFLWALEKNARAIAFYQKHGFRATGEKILEEDTTEYLIRMER